MDDDTSEPLGEIRDRYPGGLVPQLLKIQKHRIIEAKWLEWARDPQCLCRVWENPSRKRRRGDDGTRTTNVSNTFRREYRSGRNYVAVSYTSQPSENESSAVRGYSIVNPAHDSFAARSRVRDCVLDRVTKYAEHHGVDLIWIDDECINRDDADEHEMAIQSMDLVYSFSKYPVGLLTKPIESHKFLSLLQRLLSSGFVETFGHWDATGLKLGISAALALEVVEMLDYITTDKWWTRAWIFQEDYRSPMEKMCLLIPHSLCLSETQAGEEWCSIPNEVQVNSTIFHEKSTLFCLAFLLAFSRRAGEEWQDHCAKCERILKRAGRYNVLYRYGGLAGHGPARKAMSPSIFADIGSREVSKASDILAIAANCCDYSVRLSTKSLRDTSCSLSISVLALYLLNGEIIMNNQHDESLLSRNIFNYLPLLALDNFDPPVESKELTFMKNCRLVNVRLSQSGIVTSGRLWFLGKGINTGKFASIPPSERDSPNGLKRYQRWRLRQLSSELQKQGHGKLAVELNKYLGGDAGGESNPSKVYMDLMAEKVVEAIRNRQTIYLGRLEGTSQYRGVFVTDPALETPSHVFTAWSWAGSGGKTSDDIRAERLLDKIVSLEADVTGYTSQGRPRLDTNRWINGLCFFGGYRARDVVFNYPASLTGRRAASSSLERM